MTDENLWSAFESSGAPPLLILAVAVVLRYGLLNASVARLKVLGAPARKFLARRERKIELEVKRQQADGTITTAQVAALQSQLAYFAEEHRLSELRERRREERIDRMGRYIAYVGERVVSTRIWRADNGIADGEPELMTFTQWNTYQAYHGDAESDGGDGS